MSNLFVNLEAYNATDSPVIVSVDESRDPYMVASPESYLTTIDRFSIHKCWLPVFKHVSTLTIQVERKSDNDTANYDLDFTGIVDTNGFLYDKNTFANVFNNTLTACMLDFGEVLTESFLSIQNNGKAKFDFSSVANFADNYYVKFNEPLFAILSGFEYKDIVFDQSFFTLSLSNQAPYTSETDDTVRLSPVDRIIVKSSTMPLVYEYSPTSIDSRTIEPIVTDFEFGGANYKALNTINYSATSNGQYRFHSLMHSNDFRRIRLSFEFKTYDNKTYPLHMLPSGSINVKLFFKKDYEKLNE